MKSLIRRHVNLVQRARTGALQTMLNEVAETDLAVAMAANRAVELDSIEKGEALLALPLEELKAQGWASREELRLAIDAKHCSKEAPFYLRMSHERLLMRYKGQEGERPGNRAVVVMPHETAEPTEESAPLALEADEASR